MKTWDGPIHISLDTLLCLPCVWRQCYLGYRIFCMTVLSLQAKCGWFCCCSIWCSEVPKEKVYVLGDFNSSASTFPKEVGHWNVGENYLIINKYSLQILLTKRKWVTFIVTHPTKLLKSVLGTKSMAFNYWHLLWITQHPRNLSSKYSKTQKVTHLTMLTLHCGKKL